MPGIVQAAMDKVAAITGRQYHLFDYVGHPQAERVAIAMGSGAQTLEAAVEKLVAQGEKVGLVKVRLTVVAAHLRQACEHMQVSACEEWSLRGASFCPIVCL